MKNLYDILGVRSDATEAEIKAAFRRLAKTEHPDVKPGNGDAWVAMQTAYDVLIDPVQRKEYDETGKVTGGSREPPDKEFMLAMSLLQQTLMTVVMNGVHGDEDLEHIDLIKKMHEIVAFQVTNIAAQLQKSKGKLRRCHALTKRLKRKEDDGKDPVRAIMSGMELGIKNEIEGMELQFRVCERVKKIWDEYSFDFKPNSRSSFFDDRELLLELAEKFKDPKNFRFRSTGDF